MKERKQITYLQRFAWLGSLCLLAVLFMLGSCVEVKAGKKNETCKIQSVTLEINGEQQTYDGKLDLAAVDAGVDWREFFHSIKIIDYKIVENDLCNHEDGHDSITAYTVVEGKEEKQEDKWLPVSKYRNDLNEYFQLGEEFEEDSICSLHFCLDGNRDNGIEVFFSKKFKITYDTQGGKFMEGVEVPEYCLSGAGEDPLPIVEKDGYIFRGWYLEGESEDTARMNFYTDDVDEQKDMKVIASFEKGEREDISNFTFTGELADETFEVTYSGLELTPDFNVYSTEQDELYREWDYLCEFENNIEPASADDTNPPTVIVRGIGKYKGTLKKTFTITKAKPKILRYYADILEGQSLSSTDSVLLGRIFGAGNKNISGTIEWEKGSDYIPTGTAGASENYNMSFIPEDQVHYETVPGISVSVSIKKDIQSWTVELEQQNYPYTGGPIEPNVVVKDGDTELRYIYDYYVAYSHNVNCNGETASPTVTIVASGTYNYTGTREVTFTIDKATPQCETMPVCTAITEGQTLADSTFSGGGVTGVIKGKQVVGNFVWKDPEIKPSLSDSDKTKYTAVFKPLSANYNEIQIELPVSVKAKPVPTPTAPPTATPVATPGSTPGSVPSSAPATVPPSASPAGTPSAEPVVTPSNTVTENKSDLKVGDKVKDAKKKSYYVVDRVKGDAIEVRYAAPIAKAKIKSVTISATVVLENGQKAKVTAIDKNAFSGCKKLKKVVIGANVTTIKANAFKKCKKLKTIIVKTKKLKNLDKAAWKGISSKAVIKVPAKQYKEYKKVFRKSGLKKSVKIKKY